MAGIGNRIAIGRCRWWTPTGGYGVIECVDPHVLVWCHFASVQTDEHNLHYGQRVEVEYVDLEEPIQDGFRYRAVSVHPLDDERPAMRIEPIDPRDAGFEVDGPAFRVHFWRLLEAGAFASEEFEIRGADVDAVIEWATKKTWADELTFVLYAVVRSGDEIGLVRLLGHDPTREPFLYGRDV
jgi:cold shock CspA family protein